jgi:hypothetical protein
MDAQKEKMDGRRSPEADFYGRKPLIRSDRTGVGAASRVGFDKGQGVRIVVGRSTRVRQHSKAKVPAGDTEREAT